MNPIIKRFGIFSSSINPQELSLAVQSFAKVLAGILLFAGIITAEDQITIQTQLAQIIATVAAITPLAYSLWHSAEVLFGLARKVIVKLSKKEDEDAPVTAVTSV